MNSLYDLIKDDEKLGKDNRIIEDSGNPNGGDGGGGGNKKEPPTIEDVLVEIKKLNEKINNLSTKIQEIKNSLVKAQQSLSTSILESEKRIIEEIPEKIVAAIGNGKITAELDKRSKSFIAIGGIAGIVVCLLIIIIGIFGNKYVQDANRYQNLMEVFNVMPTEQYNQIQSWVQTSYQNINPSKTNTPIPTK